MNIINVSKLSEEQKKSTYDCFSVTNNYSFVEKIVTLLSVADQIAMDYHYRGKLHLNISPEKIRVGSPSSVVILAPDFNVFEIPGKAISNWENHNSEIRFPNEQALFGAIFWVNDLTERTDVFAIGSLLFFTLFERWPNTRDENNWIQAINSAYPELDEAVKEALVFFFTRTLARYPKDRFNNIDRVRRALKGLICAYNAFCKRSISA